MNGGPHDGSGGSAADELRALSAGLSGALQREARRGRRRVPAAAPVEAAPAATPAAAAAAPAPPPAPAGNPAEAAAAATGAPARSAVDVRAQAAACSDLATLRAAVARCEACSLAETRTQTVFSDGDGSRGVMFVGEAPGAEEDAQGLPFVGRSGGLLTDIITKGMGLERRTVTIANVLKCRPPENRDPSPEEKRTCTPWLDRQIELLDPKVLIPLGRHAAMHLLGVEASMGSMRGKVHEVRGRKLVATYHPAYLLRSPGQKKECWKDIQLAMGEIGLRPPASRGADAGPAA